MTQRAHQSPVHSDVTTADEGGGVGAQEGGQGGDFLDLDSTAGNMFFADLIRQDIGEIPAFGFRDPPRLAFQQRRPRKARADGVAGDAEGADLHCRPLGQADDPMLGGDIGDLEGRGDEAVGRGKIDNPPPAARLHPRYGVTRRVEQGIQVDVDDAMPDLGIDLVGALEEEFARVVGRARGPKDAERALVIGSRPQDEHFEETLELVRSSGVVIAGTMRQKRRIHPKTIVGRGKLHELILEAMRRNADVAIFDIDLKPAQARAFEDATGMKAIDRTQLILDIFAQRARSRDGKLQVELAQLRYSLPRLTDQDAGLSRLTGGIGGRGPGETVLEIGRRRIRDRIRRLEKQVEQLSKQRDVRRRRRRQQGLPVLSIVGYTNAGKSTLLNALTSSDIETEDRLFMTLDPTSRRLRFPREGEVIITDTVGFIAELPADLVAAFRATLEELVDADLLLHVIDASDARIDDKIDAVNNLLDKLDAQRMPVLKVLNKADLVADDEMAGLVARHDAVAVSATRRSGLENLVAEAESRLAPRHPTAR